MLQPARFNQQSDLVSLLFPRLVVGELLVRQSCQAKTGVADPDALSVVGEHLRGDIDQRALRLGSTISRARSRPWIRTSR